MTSGYFLKFTVTYYDFSKPTDLETSGVCCCGDQPLRRGGDSRWFRSSLGAIRAPISETDAAEELQEIQDRTGKRVDFRTRDPRPWGRD